MEAHHTLAGEDIDQVHRPDYRVHFWERQSEDYAWNLDSWVLSGCADVHEALAWADEQAQGRRYQLFAYANRTASDELLVLLLGADPNSPPRSAATWGLIPASD